MIEKHQPLDTRIEIITPENIGLRYQIAGPFRRLPAYLIDLGVRVAIGGVSMIVVGLIFGMAGIGGVGFGFWLLLAFLLTWFYGGVFEALWNGQTPGKRLMGIRVLSADGQAINGLQAVLRNVLRSVDMVPACYLLGLATASMTNRFQRLGDLACGTMVVAEQREWLVDVMRIDDPLVHGLAAEIPASFQPDRNMARVLATYVSRRLNFPPARRFQLAIFLAAPLRKQLELPTDTNPDRLLCALYHRTFITEEEIQNGLFHAVNPFGGNPFAVENNEQPN